MTLSPPTPVAATANAPETGFQAIGRQAGLAMAARVAVVTSLEAIVRQVSTLLPEVPDSDRDHRCRDGSWSTVWLCRLPDGASGGNGEPTPLLGRLPALRALFEELGGAIGLALIARIEPGGLLDWHYDPVSTDHPWMRLHLPIRTHPLAVTDLCHERVHWPAGGLYYGDYGFPHRVINGSGEERIHLYFDVAAAAVADRLPAHLRDPRRRSLREAAVNGMLAGRAAATG